ncbi:hypothetical protein [Streptomyces sp. 5-10]|uniref:hypothetical protein n=1 Tax=Streptomyces sp. 5-10 TaxID=878925 RepID=UPI00168AD9DF|nr:hypothetical protein [Streptomyces sp. 5-10]MBD3004586.1 hypothetical protein [Streptomyces sp. 5-10]
MSDHDDLTLRTVTFKGNVDDMGVVVYDGGDERVKVDFGDGGATGARGWNPGTWVDRFDLTDVTDTHDLARAWGLVEGKECECDDERFCECDDDCECNEEH